MKDASLIVKHYEDKGILKKIDASNLDKMLNDLKEAVNND